MDWKYLYTSLDGRINRKPYWLAIIGFIIVSLLAQFIGLAIGGPILAFLIALILVFPGFALNLKRAHDRNRPAWYVVVPIVLAVVLQIMQFADPAQAAEPTGLYLVLMVAMMVYGLVLFIDLGFLRGTAGPNQYGPDPLALQPVAGGPSSVSPVN